ncbi:unnamed protein product [Protopolystoma xenopodis]|uniref:Uncharacterized protein n=1 Tax=Protopolystoma xenopodis TaxID=117903 RepID=A0A448XPX0_9PLAT|nr:unnamed protein product [Protopolystoma xenopodis]
MLGHTITITPSLQKPLLLFLALATSVRLEKPLARKSQKAWLGFDEAVSTCPTEWSDYVDAYNMYILGHANKPTWFAVTSPYMNMYVPRQKQPT